MICNSCKRNRRIADSIYRTCDACDAAMGIRNRENRVSENNKKRHCRLCKTLLTLNRYFNCIYCTPILESENPFEIPLSTNSC